MGSESIKYIVMCKNIEKIKFKEKIIRRKVIKVIRRLDQFSPYPIFYAFMMSKDEKVIFDEAIKESKHYLEFGFGGSSLRTLQKSKARIYTVESSPEWVNYMRQYMVVRRFENKRLHIFPVNIGPTRDWGYPESDNSQNIFEAYSASIFQSIDSKLIDLALVDGRFRVACVMKIILECHNNNLKILIHDFWNRHQYYAVLKYLDVIYKADTLGVFSIKKDVDMKSVERDYEAYKLNPN